MCEWLEKLSGTTGEELMNELMQIDSPLAVKPAEEVIGGDCKTYTDGKFKFALSQVEETNLELLHQRRDELAAEIRRRIEAEALDFFGLLVTDAVRENSELLAVGSDDIMRNLPYEPDGPELFALRASSPARNSFCRRFSRSPRRCSRIERRWNSVSNRSVS